MTAVADGRDQSVQCNLVAYLIIAEIGSWKIVSQILYLRIWKLMRRHHGSYLDVGLLMRGTHLGEGCGNGDKRDDGSSSENIEQPRDFIFQI
jgi:hypothetical protein